MTADRPLVPLKVLIVEDLPDDAELIIRQLRRSGYDPHGGRVDIESDYLALLDGRPDIILADYSLPQFSALKALHLLRERNMDIPVIVVTGTLREDAAVECIKEGASDYLIKDRLARLGYAVEHALLEKALRDEKREAEEALRDQEEQYSSLFDNAFIGIYRVGADYRFHTVNAAYARMMGYASPEEFMASVRYVYDTYVDPSRWGSIRSLVEGSSGMATFENRYRCKDGSEVILRMSVRALLAPSGEVRYFEGLAEDVTERKQMEEQLLRAQRLEAAGRIAGQVAHDFNNLLGPLTAYPELIKMRLPAGNPAIIYCDAMLEAAQQMADINEDMMTLARRGHLQEQQIDLNQLVSQTLEQSSHKNDSVKVQLRLLPDLMPIRGSASQISRALFNLFSNASDAMPEGGILSVTTENIYVDRAFSSYNRIEVGEYVRVSVADTGSGIPVEIRDKIFDAFFSTKTHGARRGCGLGLSVVQAIVEDHRGYLDLMSEVGRGTTFRLYFPVSRGAVNEAAKEGLQCGDESILVVDDDPIQREVAKELLRILGYRVRLASSGEEALEQLRREPADLVILDMIMPNGMDGTDTYRRMLEISPKQRAIVVSGFASSQRVEQVQVMGAGAYIRKPVTLANLSQAVRDELARR